MHNARKVVTSLLFLTIHVSNNEVCKSCWPRTIWKILASGNEVPLDIWDEADIHLRELVTAIQESIKAASSKFDGMMQDVMDVTAEEMQNSSRSLQQIREFMESEVADIRSQATEDNLDELESCIIQYSEDMTKLPMNVGDEILHCVAALQSNVTMEVYYSRWECDDYLLVAEELEEEIEACRLVTDSENCISTVIITILMLTLEIPTNVDEVTRRTSDLVLNYIEAIPFCIRDRIEGANVMSSVLVGYVRSCIEEILRSLVNTRS